MAASGSGAADNAAMTTQARGFLPAAVGHFAKLSDPPATAETSGSCSSAGEDDLTSTSTTEGATRWLFCNARRWSSAPPALGRRRCASTPSDSPPESPQGLVRTATFPSALGCPYQRATSGPRSDQWRQRHADAGERLVRLALQLSPVHQGRRRSNSLPDLRALPSPELRPAPPVWEVNVPESAAVSPPPPTTPAGIPAGVPGCASCPCACGIAVPEAQDRGPRPEGNLPRFECPEDTVVIFDWDDTLFPTWFITEVVVPCLPPGASREAALPEDSPFIEPLRRHAATVRALLCAAKAVGRVGIVTLSQRPWVVSSASRYLPGADFETTLQELEIPVVYARECIRRPMISKADVEEGVNLFTIAKQAAMLKALKKLYGRNPWKNVLSIGDSIVERDAVTEVLWGHDQGADRVPCCKTVKLMEEPSVEQLGAQLVLLSMWLRSMAAHGEDFDVVMDDSEETMLRMHRRFCS